VNIKLNADFMEGQQKIVDLERQIAEFAKSSEQVQHAPWLVLFNKKLFSCLVNT